MNAPQQMPSTGDNPTIPFAPRPVAYIKKRRTVYPGATIIVSEQDLPLFSALRDSLFCSLGPQIGIEDEVFRLILNATWQLRRLAQWEEELLSQPVNPFLDGAAEARLARLRSCKAAQERSLKSALTELRRLQRNSPTHTHFGPSAALFRMPNPAHPEAA